MRIALVHQPWNDPTPPVEKGSIAIWIDRVARRLASSCEVVLYGRAQPGQPDEERNEGVRIRRVGVGRDFTVTSLLDRLRSLRPARRPPFSSPLYWGGYTRRVAAALAREQFDIIHLQNFSQLVPAVHRACPTARLVLHMHCEWLQQLDPKVIGPRLEPAALILGCSGHITDGVRRSFPSLADRCATVFNGVDTARFHPAERPGGAADPLIVFVGRITPEKGLHVLLDAFDEVLKHVPRARLRIVGPDSPTPPSFLVTVSGDKNVSDLERHYQGDYYDALRARAGTRVEFAGQMPHDSLPAAYREADVLVNPSLSESFGMSLIEAMSSGVPVVATRVGGMQEVVEHDRTGLLVEPDDAAGLAAALIRLLDDASARERMGAAARERVERHFDWDRIAETLLDAYRSLQVRDA